MRIPLTCVLLSAAAAGAWWSAQPTGVDSNLRGISVARRASSGGTAAIWATGSRGAILRSTDAGKTWERLHVPDGDALDFRGVQAFDEKTAYVMSSGEGGASRIYKTVDGGKNWEFEYTDSRKEFFLDAIRCVDETRCFALSDPVDGKFLVLHTEDGKGWSELPRGGMPGALEKEGAFAASNSSLVVTAAGEVYFATGGSAARVFRSGDWGKTWSVAQTPILSGKASTGIFSIAVKDKLVIAVGGDYQKPEQAERNAAVSQDGAKSWELAKVGPGGYRSAVADFDGGFLAIGPNGADVSKDGFRWEATDKVDLNAVHFVDGEGWAVGAKGMVARWIRK